MEFLWHLKLRFENGAGATALDKRSQQKLQATELALMGAKAQKGPRIPASIGLGMQTSLPLLTSHAITLCTC